MNEKQLKENIEFTQQALIQLGATVNNILKVLDVHTREIIKLEKQLNKGE